MAGVSGTVKAKVVIVGGGFGGIEAAKALRHAPVHVTVVDRTNHHLFQPLLYQVATAGLSPADIAAPIRSILRKARNTEVVMAEVTGVDTSRRVVLTADREIPYDFLILAPGSRYHYFGHEEWAQHAPALKTLADATYIREKVLLAMEEAELEPDPDRRRALMTFVLVGGGPTGVEMAGAIAELTHRALATDFRHIRPESARILLFEAGPRILAAFSEDLAAESQRALERLGVEVRTHARVEHVDAQGVVVNGERIASATALWTAGVVANPAGEWIGAETDRSGRVLVQPDLSVPGHPEIFVIGDAARFDQDGRALPGVSQAAMQQGRHAAEVIRRRLWGASEAAPFRYFNYGDAATVGRSFAILESGRWKLSGLFGWLAWVAVHIWYLIGFRNRLTVMLQWIWAYFTFERGARLIIHARPAPRRTPRLDSNRDPAADGRRAEDAAAARVE